MRPIAAKSNAKQCSKKQCDANADDAYAGKCYTALAYTEVSFNSTRGHSDELVTFKCLENNNDNNISNNSYLNCNDKLMPAKLKRVQRISANRPL